MFVNVIFIALAFLIIFGLFSTVLSDASDDFVNKWGEGNPLISWLIKSINIWVFLGFILFVVGSLAFNTILGQG